MKNTKKIICFLCCLVLIFTCASVSWSPHADAAAPVASYVASVVGSFILSAGFSFDNRGDFQSATEAFLESDVARGITEITDHVGRICSLGNLSEPLLIHSLIKSDFFKDFWNSIYDFFGRGDITIEGESIPAPSDGMAFYNGIELPIFADGYQTYPYHVILFDASTSKYYVCHTHYPLEYYYNGTNYYLYRTSDEYVQVRYTNGTSLWTYYSASQSNFKFRNMEVIWSNYDIFTKDTTSIYFYGSEAVVEGQENYDVIGVYNNEVYTPTDIINSWERVAENGGTIDWALDSIPAYDDITSDDKDAPVTQTQSGVLTQSGVKVQTDEEVKEEVKQEAIKELENYTVTGLASIFPFCIPFDIYNFLSVLVAEREAPHFNFVLDFGSLGVQEMEIDLSGWESAAHILRTLELMAFIIGLALATHKLIKW